MRISSGHHSDQIEKQTQDLIKQTQELILLDSRFSVAEEDVSLRFDLVETKMNETNENLAEKSNVLDYIRETRPPLGSIVAWISR